MAKNSNNSGFTWNEGELYYLVKEMGTRRNSDGDLALSQKGSDYDPTTPFIYAGKNDAKKPCVQAPDGTLLVTHKSHFDPCDAYVVAKGSNSHGADRVTQLKQRQAALLAQMEACARNLEEEAMRLEVAELAREKAREIQAEAVAAAEAEAATGTDDNES